ncbi:hypothetical protein H310_06965 [Aphanomyces invadans]|uniref:Uncharacterized protein n=1 Tax=Aphanomyces invadans TaxID=157072 RepID=A0A024U4Y6_9STRA|nr:hypothetical protein H310_06965 [Aphanomyces invadans]ETW01451.1 hypothetical protein H310_06965 [Aphanomyces invadans]|eukprot:XP_008870449.1 hypothetical protein H310_06965 [Aphanomyces invadans]
MLDGMPTFQLLLSPAGADALCGGGQQKRRGLAISATRPPLPALVVESIIFELARASTLDMHPVFLPLELVALVTSYQRGIPHNMVQLARSIHPPHAISTPHAMDTLRRWLQEHGMDRASRLQVYLPNIDRVIARLAVADNAFDLFSAFDLDVHDFDGLHQVAAAHGNLPAVVHLLHAKYSDVFGWMPAMVAAASHGHLHVLEYLVEMMHGRRTSCSMAVVNAAAAAGHVHIVQWCHEQKHQTWGSEAFTVAAAHGHVRVLSYMHHTRPRCGSTGAAMDAATTNGQLDALKFLHEHRDGGCSANALDRARRNGHNRVVEYIEAHRNKLIRRTCCTCGFHVPSSHRCFVTPSNNRQATTSATGSSHGA